MVAVAAFGFGVRAGEMRDFEVYWTAAGRAADAQPLYRADDGHYQFKYLPAFAVLTVPVASLTLDTAKALWFVVSVGLMIALLWLSVRILPHRRRSVWLLVLVMFVVMAKFYGHELVLGQVNLLFAVVAAAGILALRHDRVAAATTLFIVAVVIKPYAVIFLPWLVFLRGVRAATTIMLGAGAVLLVPSVAYGVAGALELHRAWWATVLESTAPNLTNPDNVSLAALFAKWFGMTAASRIATAVASALLLMTLVWTVVRGRDLPQRQALEGAVLLAAIPLLSPQGWDYVFLVATPAVAFFANDSHQIPQGMRVATWTALAVTGLSLYDLLGRARYAAFMSWSVITLCFLVLIAALVVLRFRRVA